jgi:hypothetical protein
MCLRGATERPPSLSPSTWGSAVAEADKSVDGESVSSRMNDRDGLSFFPRCSGALGLLRRISEVVVVGNPCCGLAPARLRSDHR